MANRPQCFKYQLLTKEEHTALKLLYAGEANSYQQRLALKVIVNNFARSHDNCFVPGEADQSNFIAGRAFVGQQILLHLNLPVGKLSEEDNNETEAENTNQT